MRILLLSNLYPPHVLGGAEILAGDVAHGLEQLGHEVFVLTSSYGLTTTQTTRSIWRTLRYTAPVHFSRQHSVTQQMRQIRDYYRTFHDPGNAQQLRQAIATIKPDIL